ncbi:hypothetical protein C7B61_17055 [filamentous cyanobacterium CCP1]|nr:hypothetical protein C7B76_28670 [filamentous cyanobacterium CCP2]PSB60707.1 hypothetical protein C7B61_17055 [filamentous cyanobacterium CCP1]
MFQLRNLGNLKFGLEFALWRRHQHQTRIAAHTEQNGTKLMMNSQSIGNNQNVIEITGRPGQIWGAMVIPAGGKTTMRIVGDTLQTTTRVNLGLETKETFTRIQKIDSVEMAEGRIWWLLIIGLFTAVWIVGLILIALFFVIKQNWIVIHSSKTSLILFHSDTSKVKQFCSNLLSVARQLNTRTPANNNVPNRVSQNLKNQGNGKHGNNGQLSSQPM